MSAFLLSIFFFSFYFISLQLEFVVELLTALVAAFGAFEAAAPPYLFALFLMSSMLRREDEGSCDCFGTFPSFREPDRALFAFGLLLMDAAEVSFILRESSFRELSDALLFEVLT